MNKKYNWGILGAGHIAKKFVNDLRLLPNANVYAVGSRSKKRAQAFTSDNNIENAYGSYEALVSDPNVDIIYIASYTVNHYSDTLLCLTHGKHVLCEKPVAINSAQFEKMVALADEKGLFFMEALWTQFLPSFCKCCELVRNQAIGGLRLIESDLCLNIPYDPLHRLYNPNIGGGSLLDIGIYPIFCALELGGPIRNMKAIATLNENRIDTSCAMLFSHEKVALSVLSCMINAKGRNETLIHGSKGMIRMNSMWHTFTSLDLLPNDGEPQHITFDRQGYGYQYEAEEVMRCIDEEKQQSDKWSWDHSRKLIHTLDEIRRITGIRYADID
jgi:predicted dehydrogenase